MDGTSRHLIEVARTSGLLSQEQLATLVAEGPPPEAPVQTTAQWLLDRGLLTPFQADEALAGRAAELVLAGHYRLEARLGAGATGTVYRAHDIATGRTVAVKVLPAGTLSDEATIARFRREAKALSRLSHPSIVQAYDADQDGDRHFLAMECVDGEDLEHAIRARRRIPPTEAAGFAYQAALGLAHAHERGLIHRDMKPANLVVTPTGRVKILDLGLARFVQDTISEPGLTQEGMGMGTPDYMAPEQFRDAHQADARSDLYSLGCTLYHALTGRVPFPGTSLAEKFAAHAGQDPDPVEASCPDCPAGLAMVVRRMMAKRPEDRFASATEVSQALGVYVAASSVALPDVHATAMWQGSAVVLAAAPRRPRRGAWALAAGAVLLVVGALAGARLWPAPAALGPATPSSTRSPAPTADSEGTITVAQDGSGHHRTIAAALDAAHPGATVRILDGATYVEALRLEDSGRHRGITIEAPREATVVAPPEGQPSPLLAGTALLVNVPGVTVRGLRLRGNVPTKRLTFVAEAGPSAASVHFEGLDVLCSGRAGGIGVSCAPAAPGAKPAVVRGCRVRNSDAGLALSAGLGTGAEVGSVVLEGNFLESCRQGILLEGPLRDVQAVGNVVRGGGAWGGIHVAGSTLGMRDLLIANNTLFTDTGWGIRIWDESPRGERIEVRGNLLLGYAGRPDIGWAHGTVQNSTALGPGDGTLVPLRWTVGHNAREASKAEDPFAAASWVPPCDGDLVADPIEVLSRVPDSEDFLRPAADSPVATAGVGADGLPPWAGALPPKGAAAWDWQNAVDARQSRVLTVSADPADGGRFRTIRDAVAEATPRATIRILDAADYPESIRLSNSGRHEGLTIEAPRRARLVPQAGRPPGSGTYANVEVDGVAGVTVRDLVLRSDTRGFAVYCSGRSEGLRLEGLVLLLDAEADGVRFSRLPPIPGSRPSVIERCTIRDGNFAVTVIGYQTASEDGYQRPDPCAGVVIRGNRIENCLKGVLVAGCSSDIQVVGNVIAGSGRYAAIELQNLLPGSRDILVANNTVHATRYGLRVWDDTVRGERIAVRANLLLGIEGGRDFVVADNGGRKGTTPTPGDPDLVSKRWKVDRNWREATRVEQGEDLAGHARVPPGSKDTLLAAIPVLSRELGSPDYLRPAADSPLAAAGVGADGLPAYVGALAPAGATAWAWEKTWEAYQPRLLTVSADPKDRGQFRTIRDALDAASPRATVRILDASDYAETISLRGTARHEGITIEAPRGARLLAPAEWPQGSDLAVVAVRDVRGVSIRGLRIQTGASGFGILLDGRVHGARIEGVDIRGTQRGDGLRVEYVPDEPEASPVVVERCTVESAYYGISVLGCGTMTSGMYRTARPCARVAVRACRVDGCDKGIVVMGAVRDVQVVGNRITGGGRFAGIELQNLLPGAQDMLIANNTVFGTEGPAVRLWDESVRGERIVLRANLTVGLPDTGRADWVVVDSGGDWKTAKGPGDAAQVLARWTLNRNWRERRPATGSGGAPIEGRIPASPADVELDRVDLIARDAQSEDFLRPVPDSPLATGGLGTDGLPPWAGAASPRGVPEWDWALCWPTAPR